MVPWPRDLKEVRFPALLQLLKNTGGKEEGDLPVSACEDYVQTAPLMAAFTLHEEQMEVYLAKVHMCKMHGNEKGGGSSYLTTGDSRDKKWEGSFLCVRLLFSCSED